MRSFEQLTEQGKIRRYHRLARQALGHYPLHIRRLRCVSARHNIIFRVDTQSGTAYALRLHVPQIRSPLQIRSEMQWLEALGRDTGLSLPLPVKTTSGAYLAAAEDEGVPQQHYVTAMRWLYGSLLSERPTEAGVRQLGQILATLHNHAERYTPPDDFMTFDAFRVDEWGPLDYLQDGSDILTAEQKRLFRAAVEQSEALLQRLRDEAPRLYLIHNDLHLKNAKIHRGRVSAFDFDDCRWGHFLQDLAPALHWLLPYEDADALRDALLAGYDSARPLTYSADMLNGAIMYRTMIAVNFVINYRSPQRQRYIEETTRWLKANM